MSPQSRSGCVRIRTPSGDEVLTLQRVLHLHPHRGPVVACLKARKSLFAIKMGLFCERLWCSCSCSCDTWGPWIVCMKSPPPYTPPYTPPYLPPPTFSSLRSTRGPAPAPSLNNMTAAVATDRRLCAPPCVCTAFCVYCVAYGPFNNKTPAVARDRLLCVPPCVCTAFCVHRLACGPLNNMTPAVATDRLLCAPLCVCPALCVHRLLCV